MAYRDQTIALAFQHHVATLPFPRGLHIDQKRLYSAAFLGRKGPELEAQAGPWSLSDLCTDGFSANRQTGVHTILDSTRTPCFLRYERSVANNTLISTGHTRYMLS